MKYTYSTQIVDMEMNYSHLYTANPLFVNKIVVTNRLSSEGAVIYGFSSPPKLDRQINWTEIYDFSLQRQEYEEWGFWLNKGSQVDLQYNIYDPSSTVLLLMIKGKQALQKWESGQTSNDVAVFLKTIEGRGSLQYSIETDERYFFIFQNNEQQNVKVNVSVNIQSKVHNPDNFKSKCYLTSSSCALQLDFLGTNTLLLTTTPITEGFLHEHASHSTKSLQQDGFWSVTVTFEQQWFAYLIFWGAMAIVMLILLLLCRPSSEVDGLDDVTTANNSTTTVSLLHHESDHEKFNEAGRSNAFPMIVSDDDDVDASDASENSLCIICFDRQRNSFYDPCGHCVACHACSKKIVKEKNAVCPLCREQIRFVRKVYVS
ncbi:hypothetical protein KP509_13G016500 [Ceratopteris richardii]|nr:hypothetical protein KP509_13G016500 [Ceratopteris richardii]